MKSIGDYWENSQVWLRAMSYYGFLQNRNYSEERGKINLLFYFCNAVKSKQKNYFSCVKISGALCSTIFSRFW